MFDFIRKHSRLIQAIMFPLILLAFGLVGIQGYTRLSSGDNATVAKVAGQGVTQMEWDNAQRQQIDRLRRQRPELDPKVLDTPELRRQALDTIVRERVLVATVDKLHLVVGDDRMRRLFVTDPQFAFIRNPDGSLNKELLSAQGLTSEMFAQRLRQDLSTQQVLAGLGATVVAPAAAASAALDALFQQREVQIQQFDTKDYLGKVAPSAADVEQYYKDPAHAAQFQAPEQASIEYVVFDLDAISKGVVVSDDDLRKAYDAEGRRFTTPEERKASHILIKADKDASASDRAKAKARADALLAELRKNPASFADLARKNSQDTISAEKGGDTDLYVARGDTDKPYEDALFALKKGDISPVVDTKDGFFIIELTDMRGGQKKAFSEVRADLEADRRKELATEQFTKQAGDFGNIVEEQSDTLKPAAEKFKLPLLTAANVTRVPAVGASGALASPKFLDALFTSDSLRNKRNTYAVDIGHNQLASGRVVQYFPARALPLADVAAKVREKVAELQAQALAHKDGVARLEALKKAPQTDLGVPSQVVSRANTREIPRPILEAALRADATKLPALQGADLGAAGYAVVRVSKVNGRDPVAADPARGAGEYARAWGDAEMQAYYEALKTRFKVDVHPPAASIEAAASAAAR